LGKKKQWFLLEGSVRSIVNIPLDKGRGLLGLVDEVL
jgi:hypothetical protein